MHASLEEALTAVDEAPEGKVGMIRFPDLGWRVLIQAQVKGELYLLQLQTLDGKNLLAAAPLQTREEAGKKLSGLAALEDATVLSATRKRAARSMAAHRAAKN
jgi:hypothetical protein